MDNGVKVNYSQTDAASKLKSVLDEKRERIKAIKEQRKMHKQESFIRKKSHLEEMEKIDQVHSNTTPRQDFQVPQKRDRVQPKTESTTGRHSTSRTISEGSYLETPKFEPMKSGISTPSLPPFSMTSDDDTNDDKKLLKQTTPTNFMLEKQVTPSPRSILAQQQQEEEEQETEKMITNQGDAGESTITFNVIFSNVDLEEQEKQEKQEKQRQEILLIEQQQILLLEQQKRLLEQKKQQERFLEQQKQLEELEQIEQQLKNQRQREFERQEQQKKHLEQFEEQQRLKKAQQEKEEEEQRKLEQIEKNKQLQQSEQLRLQKEKEEEELRVVFGSPQFAVEPLQERSKSGFSDHDKEQVKQKLREIFKYDKYKAPATKKKPKALIDLMNEEIDLELQTQAEDEMDYIATLVSSHNSLKKKKKKDQKEEQQEKELDPSLHKKFNELTQFLPVGVAKKIVSDDASRSIQSKPNRSISRKLLSFRN